MVAHIDFTLKRRGRIVDPEHILPNMGKSFDRHLFRHMKESFIRDGNEFTGEMLTRAPIRTGQLRRSVRQKIAGGKLDTLILTVASRGHPGALVQEHGARITPKNSKWLTIPGPDVKTSAGVARTSFKSWASQHKGRMVFLSSTRGTGNLVVIGLTPQKRQMRKKIAWILSKGVTIPGPDTDGSRSNFGFMETWEKFEDARVQRGGRAVVKAIHDSIQEKS